MTNTADSRREANEPCADHLGLLVRAADDCLDAAGRARLDVHLAGCEACRAALETQQLAHQMLADAYDVQLRPGLATRVVAQLEPSDRFLERLDFRRWTWRVSPVAAGLFLAAYLVVFTSQPTAAFETAGAVTTAEVGDGADAVLLSDAVNGTDLVSLIWEAELAGPAVTGDPEGGR
jgi:anti-sigma factor RsiW